MIDCFDVSVPDCDSHLIRCISPFLTRVNWKPLMNRIECGLKRAFIQKNYKKNEFSYFSGARFFLAFAYIVILLESNTIKT